MFKLLAESGVEMDPKLAMYLGYLVVTVALTVWVARTLFRNGQARAAACKARLNYSLRDAFAGL